MNRRKFLTAGAALAGTSSLPGALPLNGSSLRHDPAIEDGGRPGADTRHEFAINVEMWFGGMSFLEKVQATADLGFKWIEFWPWTNKDLDGLVRLCKKTGLQVAQFTAWGFNPGMNNPDNHDRFEKQILEACRAANKIGAPMATVVAGNNQNGMSQEQMLDGVRDGLKRGAPIAEDHNVMLIVEPMNPRNHGGHCLYGSTDAVRICRQVDSSHVKINWDLYHMQIVEGDLCKMLEEGWDQVGYLQLADNPGRNEPGTGEINYGRVFQAAWDLGYRKPIGVECSPASPPLEAARRLAAADRWRRP